MATAQLYRELLAKQSQLASDYDLRSQEAYARYCAELRERSADASNRAMELWQRFTQESRAASVGDDTAQRLNSAYRNFQDEYMKLEAGHVRSSQDAYRRLVESIGSVETDVRARALDDLIGYLREVRQTLAASPTAAASEEGRTGESTGG
jgi:hypothetical protein